MHMKNAHFRLSTRPQNHRQSTHTKLYRYLHQPQRSNLKRARRNRNHFASRSKLQRQTFHNSLVLFVLGLAAYETYRSCHAKTNYFKKITMQSAITHPILRRGTVRFALSRSARRSNTIIQTAEIEVLTAL